MLDMVQEDMYEIFFPSSKCIELFRMQIPEQDDSDLVFELRLRDDIAEWCEASLSQHVTILDDAGRTFGLRMLFNTEADMVLFKMRWM